VPFRSLGHAERRLRDRSLDLIVHPDHADLLRTRSAVITSVRETLTERGFLEIETPILQAVHGGAAARPFETFSNAYGVALSLRIAPELYLKRLVVGGFGPVFELGRNFRNEGADATHNPEFTSLEAYQPHADYTTMRRLTEDLVKAAACAVHGHAAIPHPSPDQVRAGLRGVELVDVSRPWPVVEVSAAISDAVGRPVTIDTHIDVLLGLARRHGIDIHGGFGPGAILEALYGRLVEPATTAPTFYADFPVETSPLTRPHRERAGLAERWDLVIGGMEIATAYTELTDPVDQRSRLTRQSLKAAAGDPEAMAVDEQFLDALELGMPPTGGLGIGIDRLVMLLTNTPIRSVLAFPFVRPPRHSRTEDS
jgi:lysyl-tRNA synthetase, class II